MTLMPTEQERRQARERAAELRRTGGKGSWERLREALDARGRAGLTGPVAGFRPAVAAESAERMKVLAEAHGCEFDDHGSLYLAAKNCSPDFPYGFPSPGGYEMLVHDPVPREIRDVLEEAARARVRSGDGPLLPVWLPRDRLPELAADGMARFGSLPDYRLYLLRTPGGMLTVTVNRGRDEALHRAMWGTGDLQPLDLLITFTPDGTLAETYYLRSAFRIAYEVLRADADDWWSIPGTDVQELLERSVRVKELENRSRAAAVSLYNRMVRSFIEQYGAPDTQLPLEGGAAEELQRRLRETAVEYRDAEYAELAEEGVQLTRPAAPEKPRRTFAEIVYQGLVR